ncbi:nucleotidyltransferase family protein [Candidatus Kapabacteria bacterium]|nr:nucleotidyltransferase family protein [Candidatus Kapabacteria bacterium]
MENQHIDTAIVLAGGLGTRLKSVVSDKAKPMADINGKPFISYLIELLKVNSIKKIIFCVGYLHDTVLKYFNEIDIEGIDILFSIEDEPLGTGGAIKLAINNFKIKSDVLVLNGDSIFLFNIKDLIKNHFNLKSKLTLSLKQMQNPYRYGTIELSNKNEIIKFNEKQDIKSGLINCGVYCLNPVIFDKVNTNIFSFEKDIMETRVDSDEFYGIEYNGYFIDIGLPESYQVAQDKLQTELSKYL